MLDSQNSKVETTTRVGEEEAKHFYFSLTFHEQRESHLRRRRKSEKIKGFRHYNDNTFHTALQLGRWSVGEKFS